MMKWKYYNHAAVPTTVPHEEVNLTAIEDGSIWKLPGKPLLARWTSDFECEHETNWWYCIKDEPFDGASINSKKRYEINKGKKNFDVRVIYPEQYNVEIDDIIRAAYEKYPKAYNPTIKIRFGTEIKHYRVWETFSVEDSILRGFAYLSENGDWIDFAMLKTHPNHEGKSD